MEARLRDLLARAGAAPGPVVVLTGAGISAASGIPTFRGPEGYWRIGSVNYRPEHLATRSAFERMPESVWAWYLYRRGVCLAAVPNAAHRALVELERARGERFVLVTQNVDGLHLRAGNTPARTLQVHGNLHFARCFGACGGPLPLPAELGAGWPRDRELDPATAAALRCARCGGWLRPHVLWFDECYDEANYRFDSALGSLGGAALLLVVGTAGATNLPSQLVTAAAARNVPLVVQNLEPSPFTATAARARDGVVVLGEAADEVPRIVAALLA
ncbi:MAG: RNA polymerase subunit sigma [Planctomycetes bacterium]|nr:RNA polymerase subunit sigma [Planctomycetota bacterium]